MNYKIRRIIWAGFRVLVPDVRWQHFFELGGLLNDRWGLTVSFPVQAGPTSYLPFTIKRSLALGCLPELPREQDSGQKICRRPVTRYYRLTQRFRPNLLQP